MISAGLSQRLATAVQDASPLVRSRVVELVTEHDDDGDDAVLSALRSDATTNVIFRKR